MDIKITVAGKSAYYKKGTSFLEIAEDFQKDYRYPIVLVNANGKLQELFKTPDQDTEVEFLTTGDKIGNKTLRRSISMLFIAACSKTGTESDPVRVILHFSQNSGFYYTLKGHEITEEYLHEIEGIMREMVRRKCRINKTVFGTDQAISRFAELGMHDKVKLFRTRLNSNVNIYELDGYQDYNYGFMTYDTSLLGNFSLHKYQDGIVLMMPTTANPDKAGEFVPEDKLFDTQRLGEEWAEKQGIDCVGDLNEQIINGNMKQMILISEALQEGRIAQIAMDIREKGGIKFVMIAGPSSSGKTTYSQRLCTQLSALGFVPHSISVDNYFIPRAQVPLDEYGQKDYESLRAVDVKTFNEDMTKLLSGEEIDLPTYDFISGTRIYTGEKLRLGPDEILVIEGIHCLNDDLSYTLPAESKYKIYISALTQVNVDEHNRIPTTDGRLLRRIVRDHRTRGYSAANTLAMWDSVRRGEESYIFPFQGSADVIFNSALPYELALLKLYAQPLLLQVPKDHPQYFEAHHLLKFLDYFVTIPPDDVPQNSILREFIGGGCFHL